MKQLLFLAAMIVFLVYAFAPGQTQELNKNGFRLEKDILVDGVFENDFVATALSFSVPANVDTAIIDLQGHSIVSLMRPPAYSYAAGISVACANDETVIIVKNATVRNFDAGFAFQGGQIILNNVTVQGNRIPLVANRASVKMTAVTMPANVEIHNGGQALLQ
ncbi:MAG: hypothetical protein PHT40_02105 [Patescibacteria group bacterium]|nr:hypothetical protein [Patescibacteria group bacterium]